MQTLHQEFELAPDVQPIESLPGLRGLMADQATAYAQEVRVLRQRVASLESALAAASVVHADSATLSRELRPLTIDVAPRANRVAMARSEFVEQTTPAVVAVASSTAPQPLPQAPATEPAAPAPAMTEAPVHADAIVATSTVATSAVAVDAVVPDPTPGFAQAWSAEEPTASFEERVAERAFFHASTDDQESRTWLLAH